MFAIAVCVECLSFRDLLLIVAIAVHVFVFLVLTALSLPLCLFPPLYLSSISNDFDKC